VLERESDGGCLTRLQGELGLKMRIQLDHGFPLQARVIERLWRVLNDLRPDLFDHVDTPRR
jgi:hypothetical protein